MAESPPPQTDLVPEPQKSRPGGSIRWAIGSRDGARSQSWSVFGSTNHADVYIGPRSQTRVIKLSLHKSGLWRMAWTELGASEIGLADGQNRLLSRWERTAELAPGWRHAVSVHMTRASLTTHLDESKLEKVAFYPPPDLGDMVRFMLLLGEPGGAELKVNGALDVGSLQLPNGGMVGVIVNYQPMNQDNINTIDTLRAQMLAAVTATGARGNRSFAWGHLAGGAVLLTNPGAIEPPGIGRGGAPGRLTYVRRVDPVPEPDDTAVTGGPRSRSNDR
jgi:hypothetical protein